MKTADWILLGIVAWLLLRLNKTRSFFGDFSGSKITYISADWCPACAKYTPKLMKWWANNDVEVERIKVKDWQDPIIKKYKINSLPYTLVNNKEVDPFKLLEISIGR